jgi:hypothetical protein
LASLPGLPGVRGVLFLLCLLTSLPAAAALIESQFTLTVKVSDAYSKQVERAVIVTTFVDDATPVPRPVLVINHGRAGDPASRVALGRARYTDNARWFTQFGFIVAMPTRIGYGVTGGDDVEHSGPCSSANYGPGFTAAAVQVLAVLDHLRGRADVRSQQHRGGRADAGRRAGRHQLRRRQRRQSAGQPAPALPA